MADRKTVARRLIALNAFTWSLGLIAAVAIIVTAKGPSVEDQIQAAKENARAMDDLSFSRVKIGMTLSEIEEFAGEPDSHFGESETRMGRTSIYVWRGPRGGHAKITFQDGKVYRKTQSGLR